MYSTMDGLIIPISTTQGTVCSGWGFKRNLWICFLSIFGKSLATSDLPSCSNITIPNILQTMSMRYRCDFKRLTTFLYGVRHFHEFGSTSLNNESWVFNRNFLTGSHFQKKVTRLLTYSAVTAFSKERDLIRISQRFSNQVSRATPNVVHHLLIQVLQRFRYSSKFFQFMSCDHPCLWHKQGYMIEALTFPSYNASSGKLKLIDLSEHNSVSVPYFKIKGRIEDIPKVQNLLL